MRFKHADRERTKVCPEGRWRPGAAPGRAAGRDQKFPAPGLSRRLRHAHPLGRGGRRDPPCLHLQAADRRPGRRDRDRDQRDRFRAVVVAAPRDPAEGALFLVRRSLPLGRRFLQGRRQPDLLHAGRGGDAGGADRAAATTGEPRGLPAGDGAGRRSAFLLQAPGRPGTCREAAGRHQEQGEDRVKIARIDTHSVKVPYTFGGSHKGEGLRTWTTNNILLVRVETDSGIVGWGEAFCYACTDAVRAAVHNMIAPIAVGQDARDIAKLSYDLQQKLHLFGRYGITIFALSGLDIALWDIAGKAANLPLHRLLGGSGRDSLPAYASLLKYRDPEKVAARTKQAVEQGYRHIKLHETEEPEVKAARLAAGNDVAIMVDTNCPPPAAPP